MLFSSILLVPYFMWISELDSSSVLQSHSIISLASPMTCQYADIYPLLNIQTYKHIYLPVPVGVPGSLCLRGHRPQAY